MSLIFDSTIIAAGALNVPYSSILTATGGTGALSYAIVSGSLPLGLTLTGTTTGSIPAGTISGTPTELGAFTVILEVSDSTLPTHQIDVQTFVMTVSDFIDLSNLTVDQAQFVTQFQNALAGTNTWSTGITSSTSQTLIDLISAVGTYLTGRLVRIKEDAFPNTAQADSAIFAITDMLGIRLSRKFPAQVSVTLQSLTSNTIPPFTQFSIGAYQWFNTDQIVVPAGIPVTAVLKQGTVSTFSISGLSTDLQAWVSPDAGFSVSDQDVQVTLNSTTLNRVFGQLWNYPQSGASGNSYVDRTLADGSLVLQFGSGQYGVVPKTTDIVGITYATTQGATLNTVTTNGASVTVTGYSSVTGTCQSNPTGGADQKAATAYKNFSAGTFGTFSSAVTKSQYNYIANSYPGVVDAVVQAQRDINPAAVAWMNVMRVSSLNSGGTPTSAEITAFLQFLKSQTMYSTQFVWQAPIPIARNIDMSVYFFNSVASLSAAKAKVENAIQTLFAPRAGILMTNFYASDLIEAANAAAPGQVSYVVVNAPTGPMLVTPPASPEVIATVQPIAGALTGLGIGTYSYAVSVNAPAPNPLYMGLIDASLSPSFPTATAAGQYWVVQKGGSLVGGTTTTVAPGDRVQATSPGSVSTDFTVTTFSSSATWMDIGAVSNWVFPACTAAGKQILLDWSANANADAAMYVVWGRTAAGIGVLQTGDGLTLQFLDNGVIAPVATTPILLTGVPIRYNSILEGGSLTVNTYYAARQQGATLPVRDTLT